MFMMISKRRHYHSSALCCLSTLLQTPYLLCNNVVILSKTLSRTVSPWFRHSLQKPFHTCGYSFPTVWGVDHQCFFSSWAYPMDFNLAMAKLQGQAGQAVTVSKASLCFLILLWRQTRPNTEAMPWGSMKNLLGDSTASLEVEACGSLEIRRESGDLALKLSPMPWQREGGHVA